MYIIYTKPECPNCDKAIGMLQLAGKMFKVFDVGVDISVEHFKVHNPDIRTMPYVVTDRGEGITSVIRLAEHLKERK